jgi:mRNA interferase MazF
MPLTIVPDAGDVLICDFNTGFKPPEMVKVRRVVVLSPRSRTKFPETFIVVPISKTPPMTAMGCHCRFAPRSYEFFDPIEAVWAKADLVTCVAHHRLDRLKINGRYSRAVIRRDDLQRVRKAVLHALGMETWREVEAQVVAAQAQANK